MSETTRARPSGVALTGRQREVLELIERGHTNFEIAQALGISLEGAKYHVREVMTKLGADSREEAVQFWRESQQPRWSVRGLLAVPWLRIVAAGGGVVLVVAVALAGFALANRDDRTGERVLVAYTTMPAEEPALVVLGGDGREVFRAEGSYGGPRFSPDGTRLAAIDIDGEARIDIFDTSNWSSTQYVPATFPFSMGWSPDSTLLAVVLPDRVVFVDRRGKEVEATGQLVEASLGTGLEDPQWAPDSERLVATLEERLFLVLRAGDVEELKPPEGNGAGRMLRAIRWNTSTELFVLDFGADRDPDRYAFLVSLEDGSEPVWTETPPELGLSLEAEAFRAELEQRFPALDIRLPAPTADGIHFKSVLSEEAPSGGSSEPPRVQVVINASELVVVPLGNAIAALAERNVDAVVVRH
ncbi:MAG: LuxR C-terminal-related transcriptional regulator [Dehalococcoidia bacterium]|nr:LuxR C-terminal-related transcriptional regulator [Dehalococcoidia bacterium]